MPEQPVQAGESSTSSVVPAPPGVGQAGYGAEAPGAVGGVPPLADSAGWGPSTPGPRVVAREDLGAALRVLVLVALCGPLWGGVWALLAPPQRFRLYQGQQWFPLPLESYHRFDAMAVFLLIGLGAGVLTGAAVWLWRARRGPAVLLAAVLGSVLAAWLAARCGLWFAELRYPEPASPLSVGAVVTWPPVLESVWVVLAQPLGTALAYGAAAAWHGEDDLGRHTA